MADRRDRLVRAMTEVAALHGYAGATVTRVVSRAGVSRTTFYEHFRDRDDCFAASYERALSRFAAVVEAFAAEPLGRRGRRGLLERLLAELAADPASGRVLLVEPYAAAPRLRARHERLLVEMEEWTEGALETGDGLERSLQIPAAPLLGGIAGTVSNMLFAGKAADLPAIASDLVAWIGSYALPPGGAPVGQERWRQLDGSADYLLGAPNRPAALLPRGRSALAEPEAGHARRERILAATARVVAERGYRDLTVARIGAAARLSRGAFYSCFSSRLDAFLAGQDKALQDSIGAAASRYFSASEWPERVWRAGAAMLSYGVRNPDLTYLWVVESCAAGAEAMRRQHDACIAYAIFLEEGYRLAAESAPPRIASNAIAWAVFSLLRREVLLGRTDRLLSVLPRAAYVILAPFIGPRAALEFIEERSRSADPAVPALL